MNKQKQTQLMKVISLVKWKDEWAVQVKSVFIWTSIKYIDLRTTEFRWRPADKYFSDCLGTEERAREVYDAYCNITIKPKIEVIETRIKK